MTDWVPWFQYQLQASADGFTWAYSQVAPALLTRLPPDPGYLGTWVPLRHLWHVTEYERCLALPAMRTWLDPSLPAELPWPDDDDAWSAAAGSSPETLLAEFRRVRQEQIDLLPRLAGVDWLAPRDTLWGDKPLAMVVTKTFQHTFEHGDTILRMGLWWETILAEIEEAKAAESAKSNPPA